MTTPKQRKNFSLRLSPEARELAAAQARQEGISLNHFISLAIAEKISRTEQELIRQQAEAVPRLPAAPRTEKNASKNP